MLKKSFKLQYNHQCTVLAFYGSDLTNSSLLHRKNSYNKFLIKYNIWASVYKNKINYNTNITCSFQLDLNDHLCIKNKELQSRILRPIFFSLYPWLHVTFYLINKKWSCTFAEWILQIYVSNFLQTRMILTLMTTLNLVRPNKLIYFGLLNLSNLKDDKKKVTRTSWFQF